MPRKKEYQLGTFLDIEKEIICKYSLCNESLTFLYKLNDSYFKLNKTEPCINFNKILRVEKNKIYFEFIDGKTLEESLFGRYSKESIQKYIKCIESFSGGEILIEDIKKGRKVFGNNFGNDSDYIISGILDLIPSNIIEDTQANIHVIDYEWVFNFPISRKFIAWRSIYYHVINHRKQNTYSFYVSINSYYSISILDQIRYFSMEHYFQQYVHTGKIKSKYYKIIGFYLIVLKNRILKLKNKIN